VKVLTAPAQSDGKAHHVVLWGSGTVGAAIDQALQNRGCTLVSDRTSLWDQPATLTSAALHSLTGKQLTQAAIIHHVFAAGSAGFSSTPQQCNTESNAWNALLDGVCQQQILCSQTANPPDVQLHLISSAGGLFEGQKNVSSTSAPNPLRAYGHLKLAQESTLVERLGTSRSHIYRLSSVYGTPHPQRRGSLIANLILNSFSHKVTQVTGNLDTLRDYIHAEDVAAFVADKVLDKTISVDGPLLLASGRSTSILEVLRVVEQITFRKPLVALSGAHNAASISFLPSALAYGFAPADLRTRVATLLKNYTP